MRRNYVKMVGLSVSQQIWIRVAALLVVIAMPICRGAVQNTQVVGTTATQAVLSFDVPDPSNCVVQVSTDSDFSSRVNDSNTQLFPGSQSCARASSIVIGSHVTFVAGLRTSRQGTDGNFYSLALEASRKHYFRIVSEGVDIDQGSFDTVAPPFGNTYPEPPPFDAAAPFNYAYPTVTPVPIGASATFVNDPLTGIPFAPVTKAGLLNDSRGFQVNANRDAVAAKDISGNGNWTSVGSAFLMDGASATNSGANQDALYIRFPPFCRGFVSAQPPGGAGGCNGTEAYQESPFGIVVDDVQLQLATGCTGNTVSYQVALTVTGSTPATDWQTIPCNAATATCAGHALNCIYYPATANWPGTRHGQTVFNNWFAAQANNRITSLDMSNQTGTVSVDGAGNVAWVSGDKFRPSMLVAGSYINLGGTDYQIMGGITPTALSIASPPAAAVYNYQIANFGVLIRKAAATAGNLTVDGVEYSDAESQMGQSPLSGLVDFCAVSTVTDSGGNVLRPCFFIQNADRFLYAFEEATGKTRFIGTADVQTCSTGNCASSAPGSALNNYGSTNPTAWSQFNPTNPAVWYAFDTNGANGQTFLIKSTYNAAGGGTCPGDWQEITAQNCPSFPGNDAITQDNLTPASNGNDLGSKATAFNTAQRALHPEIPVFDSSIWSSVIVGGSSGDPQNGWQTIHFGGQDALNFDVILDPTTAGTPVVGMIPTWSAGNMRFCGDHGSGTQAGVWGISAKAVDADNSRPGVGAGVWQAQVTTSLDLTSAVCSGITDPRFTSYNGQTRCRTIAITEPCHTQNRVANEKAPTFGVCSWNSAFANFAGLVNQPGDVLDDSNGTGGEMFLIVSIPDSTHAQVVRSYATPAPVFARSAATASHTATWLARERCTANDGDSNHSGIYWIDLNIDPNGIATNSASTGVVDFASQINGHLDYWFFPTQSIMIQGGLIRTRPVPKSNFYNAPFDAFVQQSSAWNTFKSGINSSPGYIQSHQGSSRDNANPFYGIDQNALGNAAVASTTLWNQTATKVSGDLWKIAAADIRKDASTPWPSGVKQIPYVMWSGGYLMKDISGPAQGNTITDTSAGNYKFCVVYVAGECRVGSSVGDVYVNRPGSAHDGKCGPWDYTYNLCGTTWDAIAAGVNQYDYSWVAQDGSIKQDTSGRAFRKLSLALNRPGFQVVFASAHGSFSGKWAFAAADYYSGGNRGDFLVMKLPPQPAHDTIARNGFVNIPVTVGAGGGIATRARARFGYAENGTPAQFYCSYNRKEECRSRPDTTSEPYYFASEPAQALQDCTNGCTILIPAIPGRVLYYAVDYLDSSGNVLQRGNTQVGAVP